MKGGLEKRFGGIHKKVGQSLKLKASAYAEAKAGRESSRLKARP